MKDKRLLYIIVVLAALIAAAVFWQSQGGIEIESVQARSDSITVAVEDTALVQAATDHDLYAIQNARIKIINVQIGQMTEKDQLIIQMENPELQLQLSENKSMLAQAQSSAAAASAGVKRIELQLADARSNAIRSEELFNQGAISQMEYEQALLLLDTAQAALNEQESYLVTVQSQISGLQDSLGELQNLEKELQVYSPIQGVILSLPVKEGQPVAAGMLLATIAADHNLEIKADILSDDLADIQVGQKVLITAVVIGDRTLEGTVSRIYPRAEEKISALGVTQRRVPVIISLDDQANLKPGYEVRVAIQTRHLTDVLTLPIESVRQTAEGKKQVMIIEDNRIKIKEVKTGLSDGNQVEIESGLKEGDRVVKDASQEIKENLKVSPGDASSG